MQRENSFGPKLTFEKSFVPYTWVTTYLSVTHVMEHGGSSYSNKKKGGGHDQE